MTCEPGLDSVDLGFTPLGLRVRLVRDAGFWQALRVSSGSWPAGAEVTLQFSADGTTWSAPWMAGIDGARAVWNVAAAQVETVYDSDARFARLRLAQTGVETLTWARGGVIRA